MTKNPNKLQAARLHKGLSVAQVASYIGLKNEETLQRWENGDTLPSTPFAFKLCALYGVSVGDLYPEICKRIAKEMAPEIKQAMSKKLKLKKL